jgi:hypothetical protein
MGKSCLRIALLVMSIGLHACSPSSGSLLPDAPTPGRIATEVPPLVLAADEEGGPYPTRACATLAAQPWVCAYPTSELEDEGTPLSTPDYLVEAMEAYPLGLGATWEYAVEITYESSDAPEGLVTWRGTITTRVTGRDNLRGRVRFTIAQTVHPDPPPQVWVSNYTTEYEINSQGVTAGGDLLYKFPLQVGATWDAFSGLEYQWYVSEMADAVTPFRTFRDCYVLVLVTGPDTTYDWFCNGFGVVRRDCFHHGETQEGHWKLTSFTAGGR